jgi:hypothetical protein
MPNHPPPPTTIIFSCRSMKTVYHLKTTQPLFSSSVSLHWYRIRNIDCGKNSIYFEMKYLLMSRDQHKGRRTKTYCFFYSACSGLGTLWRRSGSYDLSDRIGSLTEFGSDYTTELQKSEKGRLHFSKSRCKSSKALLKFFPFPKYFMAILATFPDLKLMESDKGR